MTAPAIGDEFPEVGLHAVGHEGTLVAWRGAVEVAEGIECFDADRSTDDLSVFGLEPAPLPAHLVPLLLPDRHEPVVETAREG